MEILEVSFRGDIHGIWEDIRDDGKVDTPVIQEA